MCLFPRLKVKYPKVGEFMVDGKFISFKNTIKRTFTTYALFPIITITLLSYIVLFSMWYNTILTSNRNVNKNVSDKFSNSISQYMEATDKISKLKLTTETIKNDKSGVEIYEAFYSFINNANIKGNFFLLDKNMNPIILSNSNLPPYIGKDSSVDWGIRRKMMEDSTQVVLSLSPTNQTSSLLTIGKAVVDNEQIIGFITFDIKQSDLLQIVDENFSINVVVTDKFGYVVASTNEVLVNQFGKIEASLKDQKGFISAINDKLYISKTQILNNNLTIYTISSVGYITTILLLVGILLVGLFILLTVSLMLSARIVADSKTRAIDDIIAGIENIQKGNLSVQLNIHTNDEFQIIAESYNKMLNDIKDLIETNKEKARQNVLSEIKQLESQFNPHFLFNTLETVKYMSIMEPASVSKIIVALSTLLRYSINNAITRVTIKDDIEYTKNYLLIQKYRFGERFDYSINLEPETSECIVPKLIVQPLLENSIKYGFESKKALSVKIKVCFANEKLVIVVYDDGIGIEPQRLSEIRELLNSSKNSSVHIGLFNVHRRVQLMYGDEYGIEILSEQDTGTVVKIVLPINIKGVN